MAGVVGDTSCAIHPDRHGVARCPECSQFYCSECITEHEGRLTCAACLALSTESSVAVSKGNKVGGWVAVLVQAVAALLICWLIFYVFAQTLGDMPDEFHDGTIWE